MLNAGSANSCVRHLNVCPWPEYHTQGWKRFRPLFFTVPPEKSWLTYLNSNFIMNEMGTVMFAWPTAPCSCDYQIRKQIWKISVKDRVLYDCEVFIKREGQFKMFLSFHHESVNNENSDFLDWKRKCGWYRSNGPGKWSFPPMGNCCIWFIPLLFWWTIWGHWKSRQGHWVQQSRRAR